MNDKRQAKARIYKALSQIGPCDTEEGMKRVLERMVGKRRTIDGKTYYVASRVNPQTKETEYSLQCEGEPEPGGIRDKGDE